jgi:hypothetical protein
MLLFAIFASLMQEATSVRLNVLGLCVLSDNIQVLQRLLSKIPSAGVAKHVLDKNLTWRHQRLYHLACSNSSVRMIQLLLSIGVVLDPLSKDVDGRTPLHHLVRQADL